MIVTPFVQREVEAKLRVFVVIASYGEKNLKYLRHVIQRYQDMALDVDIVVSTNARKSVDLGVDSVVGTPTKNPFSLPFAHKQLFAKRLDKYDLYVYTEDDIDVTEENIRAFVRAVAVLEPNEIAGYVRYEAAPDGRRYLPDVHGRFHWRPNTVRQRGQDLFAEFTNEHAGFYILTNDQLSRAIASGHYLVEPYQGRYTMLESAATNIYVNCGFHKVICISQLDKFLVHHIPNKYVDALGMPLSQFEEQLEVLTRIQQGSHPATTLGAIEPTIPESHWGKRYDEQPTGEFLEMLPTRLTTALSVGYGGGAAETELQRRGAKVTAFPLDSVVGAAASRRGIEVFHGTLEQCLSEVSGRRFQCVIITNLIHLWPRPWPVLRQIAALVDVDGSLIIEGHNFQHLPTLVKRAFNVDEYGKTRTFVAGGLHTHGVGPVKRVLNDAGLRVVSQRWTDRQLPRPFAGLANWIGRFGARTWVLKAQRPDVNLGHD